MWSESRQSGNGDVEIVRARGGTASDERAANGVLQGEGMSRTIHISPLGCMNTFILDPIGFAHGMA